MCIKLFFPCSFVDAQTGVLKGYYQHDKNCYHVLLVESINISKKLYKEDTCEILGFWCNPLDDLNQLIAKALSAKHKEWIIMKRYGENYLVMMLKMKKSADVVQYCKGVIMFYSEMNILELEILLPKITSFIDHTPLKFAAKTPILKTASSRGDCTKHLYGNSFSDVADAEMILCLCRKALKHNCKRVCKKIMFKPSFVKQICLCGACICHRIFFRILNLSQLFAFPQLKQAFQVPSVGSHLSLKTSLFLLLLDEGTCKQQKWDLALAFLLDTVFGILFCILLFYCSSIFLYASEVLPYLDFIAKEVEELIRWLMGIPIGLKLNSPLNQFLGKFFLHHVRLWLEYIQMILLAFGPGNERSLLWLIFLSCFGFSFFIAVCSDILSVLSFHVYCFYVYATRLYGLQIAGLVSFWRLFRGKKWNPLRQRVDTLSHSPDVVNHRFFIGTLLFTILLFLLPTTALYYAIFAILRIATLCIQKPMHWLADCIACFPWFTLLQRFCRPHAFVTHARFIQTDVFHFDPTKNEQVQNELPKKGLKYIVNDLTVLKMVFDIQSYKEVVCTGLKRAAGISHFTSINLRQISTNLLSGKLLKWF